MGKPATLSAALDAITALEGQLATAQAELATSNETRAAAQTQAQANFTALTQANEQISALTSDRDSLTAQLATANSTISANATRISELQAAQTDFDAKVSAAAARQLAASGHAPLNLGVDNDGKPEGKTAKPDLKGRDRVVAAISTQLTK